MILFTGGYDDNDAPINSTFIYDHSSQTITAADPMTTARKNHSATLLPDGKIFVAGGRGNSDVLATAEIYNPDELTWALNVQCKGHGRFNVVSLPTGINCGVDCGERFKPATEIVLTPTFERGTRFDGWSGDEDCHDGVVTMTSNRNCIANFSKFPWSIFLNFPR